MGPVGRYTGAMPLRRAICLVVDGLRASSLGAYGGSWPTPAFDRVAAEALVADWAWAAGPKLSDFYRSIWTGRHSLRPPAASSGSFLSTQLHDMGVQQSLTTDDNDVAEWWEPGQLFDERVVDIPVERRAVAVDDTALARLFAVAAQQLMEISDAKAPQLAWIHTHGLLGPWDAPLELHAAQLDEDDPSPRNAITPPVAMHSTDPDELLVLRTAYAAQVAVLDACLDGLLAALQVSGWNEDALVVIAGARGFALGEHGGCGSSCSALYSELLHTPLLVRIPDQDEPLPRIKGACHAADVSATLLDWFGATPPGQNHDSRSLLDAAVAPTAENRPWQACRTGSEFSVRTPGWMLHVGGEGPETNIEPELYAKPDDRWEANEIASRCPTAVEMLKDLFQRLAAAADSGDALEPGPLAEELVRPWR